MADIYDRLLYESGTTGSLVTLPRVKNHNLYSGERQYATSSPWNGQGVSIDRIYRGNVKYEVEFLLTSGVGKAYAAPFNTIFDMFQADIDNHHPGRLWLGNQSIECYGDMGREMSMFCRRRDGSAFGQINVTFVSSTGLWETTQQLSLATSGTSKSFSNGLGGIASIRVSWAGAVTNPSVTVAGKVFGITGTITAGQTLWMDGATQTIYLVNSDGTRQYADNMLSCTSSSIFPVIPLSGATVIWTATKAPSAWFVRATSFPRWGV
jgi:hypothetical protein